MSWREGRCTGTGARHQDRGITQVCARDWRVIVVSAPRHENLRLPPAAGHYRLFQYASVTRAQPQAIAARVELRSASRPVLRLLRNPAALAAPAEVHQLLAIEG